MCESKSKDLLVQLKLVSTLRVKSGLGTRVWDKSGTDPTFKKTYLTCLVQNEEKGLFQGSNAGPPAPKAGIIPLDQTRIRTLGKNSQRAMIQLTIHLIHALNMQGRSSSVYMQLLTEVPEVHLKLWSGV